MLEDCRIKALPRILLRLATGAAAFLLVAFALLVLWLRHYALPNIDAYRGNILSSIEKASGMKVNATGIRGGWEGLRPSVSLQGFEIADRRGKVALSLERADLTLSWWALLVGRVRFQDVDFYRPALSLRRGTDGLIYLADKPLNQAGPGDGAFTEWLLAQPRLAIHDATLVWRDDKGGAPELRLRNVEISVRTRRGHHQAALTALPPPELAGRIDLRADVALARAGDRWGAAGQLFVEARGADLGALRAYLPVPETLRSGVGSLRVWVQFAPDGLKEVVADLNMRDARAQLAADVLPLDLATIAGRATYRVERDGFAFATEGLRFRLASGPEVHPGKFSLARDAPPGKRPRLDIRADGIDLKIAATLLDYFPVPRDVKGQVLRFAPRGRIADAELTWTGEAGATPQAYTVNGRFEDLAVNAVDNFPGASGLTGRVKGTQDGGTLELASKNVGFQLDQFFRAPLALDSLEASARWKREGKVLVVDVAEARFANADAEGKVAGQWRSIPDSMEKTPGFVDLKGTFSRADPRRLGTYLPNRLAGTRDWVDRSVLAGTVPRATFEVRGDLWHFPFGDNNGKFLVEGDIHGGQLRYHPDWPSIDAIDGSFRFEDRRMEIRAQSAAIFASRASAVSAVIADLRAKPPVLMVAGDIDTTGADAVRFLRDSPLVNGPGAFTRTVAIEGPGKLKLALQFPLFGTELAKVAGDYTFDGATANVGRALEMRDVRGRLAFTERGVRAPAITGTLFGKPVAVAMSTQADNTVLTTLEGSIDPAGMADHVPGPIAARLSGAAAWKARLVSGKQGSDLTVTSDLAGLGSTLPAPLAKAAPDARSLSVQVARLGTETETIGLTLGEAIHGRLTHAGASGSGLWSVALKFGAPVADEPVREGLWLYGELPSLDVDAWQSVFAAPPGAAPATAASRGALELRGVDLALGEVRYFGRDFRQMRAQLARVGSQWSGKLESPKVAGDVQWNAAGKGRLVARLDRMEIGQAAATSTEPAPQTGQGDLPAIDVVCEKFDFRGRWLGKLELKAEPVEDEWRIDKLDITNEHAQFRSTGGWRRTGAGSLTTLDTKLEAQNLSSVFKQFGYGDYLRRGTGHLEGTLVWPGYPYDFSLSQLAGTFKVEARDGQFAKIEPGAGKLLGLLSLQSLPRRALLDFRDVFSEGFAFQRISGEVKVARGILLADGFEISGPAAFVSLSGEVSLPQETQTLTMRIVPEVGEGLALAATLIGTPVLGLSTLLVSKLLRNPLGKVAAYEYQVTGSWDNPQVTRVAGPPPKTAANPEAPATGSVPQ